MKRRIIALFMVLSLTLVGCGQNSITISDKDEIINEKNSEEEIKTTTDLDSSTTETSIDITDMFSKKDIDYSYDEEECTIINLSEQSEDVTITSEGIYKITGSLSDSSVIIDATKNDKIRIILDNVSIESKNSAALYVKNADKVFVTAAKDSVNTLKTTGEFEADGDTKIDAVIYSKSDITFNGEGKIIVSTEFGNGITSNDDLVIASGNYDITASKHGLEGKKSIRIADGNVVISCLKDGLHSEKEESDDGYIYIEGGNIEISAGDDGIHAQEQVIINGGNIDIVRSNEGIEGLSIEVLSGNVYVEAQDDGLNATDGNGEAFGPGGMGGFAGMFDKTDGEQPHFENMQPPQNGENPWENENFNGERPQMPDNGWTPENGQMPDMGNRPEFGNDNSSSDNVFIKISGGIVDIKSSGDGIDSNGSLYITGGEVYVTSTANTANGALDFNDEGIVSGGVIVAAGYSSMPQNFSTSSTQGAIMVNTNKKQASGTIISLKDNDGKELLSYTAQHEYNNVVVSCPGIELNGKYTLSTGDESQEIIMESIIYGESNGFGPMGGRGGFGGDFRGDRDNGNSSEKKKRKNNE